MAREDNILEEREEKEGMQTSRDECISSPVKASPSGIFSGTLHPT